MKIIVFIQLLLIIGLTIFSIYSYGEHKDSFKRDYLQADVNHAIHEWIKAHYVDFKEQSP